MSLLLLLLFKFPTAAAEEDLAVSGGRGSFDAALAVPQVAQTK